MGKPFATNRDLSSFLYLSTFYSYNGHSSDPVSQYVTNQFDASIRDPPNYPTSSQSSQIQFLMFHSLTQLRESVRIVVLSKITVSLIPAICNTFKEQQTANRIDLKAGKRNEDKRRKTKRRQKIKNETKTKDMKTEDWRLKRIIWKLRN